MNKTARVALRMNISRAIVEGGYEAPKAEFFKKLSNKKLRALGRSLGVSLRLKDTKQVKDDLEESE